MKPPPLPPRFYWTMASLAAEYRTDADTILYYLDSGIAFPSALVPWWKLHQCGAVVTGHKGVVEAGPSPHVCVLLPDYRALPWRHAPEGSTAQVVGTFRGFAVDGDAYESLTVSIPAPLTISRDDLVLTAPQREELDAAAKVPAPRTRPIRERNLLRIIAAILRSDSRGAYAIGRWVQTGLDMNGTPLALQTVADAIRDARGEVSQLGAAHETGKPMAA